MRPQSLLRTLNTWQVGLIMLAVIAAFAAGTSGLVYPSMYSPLIIGAFTAAVVTLVAWFLKPVWALYAALFVVLLPIGLIPPQVHSILNRSMTVIALGVWLFDVITRRRRVVWTSSASLMLGFVTWGTVTLFWTAGLSVGMTALQAYALRLILYLILIANEIRTEEDLDGLMNTLALNGWVLVLVGAGVVLLEGYKPGTRLQVLDMNENAFGISALVTMPGVLWQAMRTSGQQKAVRMLLSFIFVSLTLVLVALTGSRGSAISLLIPLSVFWLWKPTRPWGKLGLLILVLAAITAPFIFLTVLERFAVEPGDTLLGGREALWQAVWPLILDHIWRGVGIGNSPYAVMPYLERLGSVWAYERAAIHNPVLAIWAETGVLGSLLYLGVLGSSVWLFVRQYQRHRKAGVHCFMPYFALVSSIFLGYMPSWVKGGGMESDITYFLMLALLVVPSHLDVAGPECAARNGAGGK
jgi:putative inorganic carbon (HCO3(-)) transporter